MTVTVVCDVLGKENNGSTVAANNLINYLKSAGHTVKVLCADCDKTREDGYYTVPSRNFLCFNGYVRRNGVTLAKPDEAVIREAVSGSDIVHVMFPFALGIASAKIAKQMNVPVTAGFHMLAENFTSQLGMEDVELVNKLTYAHFHKLYSVCDAIHFPTAYLKTLYEDMYGKTTGYVVSNGVNDMFKPKKTLRADGLFTVLSIGRLSKEKSQATLIDAVKLSRHKSDIRLVLCGCGPLKDKLEKQAEDLPVPAVFGFYPRTELVDVINSADLYVHSAKIEAEGISCLEAMACGVVPVISNSPKCATKAYALSENNLFEYGNAADLADKIDWWIEHPDAREKAAEDYAEYARENFDQTECMRRTEAMLLQTAERCGKIYGGENDVCEQCSV